MKFFMIALLALVMAGAGGAGGYFFFKQSAVASLGPVETNAMSFKLENFKKAEDAEELAKKLRFVELDPIILPIIDQTGVSQVVTLIVSLEVLGDSNADYAKQMAPRLKDAFIQDMYGVLNRKASLEGGVIKVDDLKERLNRVSSKVLGEKKVNGVLLQAVNQRPI